MRTDDPRSTLKALFESTHHNLDELSEATGITANRLKAGLSRIQYLSPAEISVCHNVLLRWIASDTTQKTEGAAA